MRGTACGKQAEGSQGRECRRPCPGCCNPRGTRRRASPSGRAPFGVTKPNVSSSTREERGLYVSFRNTRGQHFDPVRLTKPPLSYKYSFRATVLTIEAAHRSPRLAHHCPFGQGRHGELASFNASIWRSSTPVSARLQGQEARAIPGVSVAGG